MSAYRRLLWVGVLAATMVIGMRSQAEPWSLVARLLDAKSGAPAPTSAVGRVAAEVEEDARDLSTVGEGRFSVELPKRPGRLTVIVDPRERLVPRRIPLAVRPSATKTLPLTLHLVERGPITYEYVRAPRAWADRKEHDRALAAFEFGFRDLEERGVGMNQLRVTIEYYYGLTLRNACESLRYDTCTEAADRFGSLIRRYKGNEKYFVNVVTLAEITAAKAAAERVRLATRYDDVRVAYAAGEFAAAAEGAEALLADDDAGRIRLQGTGISADRLRLDAGAARARLGDALARQATADEALENYRTAARHARAVVRLNKDQASRDASLLNEKINVLQRSAGKAS